ncbi:MAG: hypothetical protein ACTHM1_13115 [Solirubrobacteraceae bacterium]
MNAGTDEGEGGWRAHALELRRRRIVGALVDAVCEQGVAGTSVSSVCARAKVSRAGFHEVFDDREDCFVAALDECHRRARLAVIDAFEGAASWLDGKRAALAGLLVLFESEPGLARLCIVESLALGQRMLERRERHVMSLGKLIFDYWGELAPKAPYPQAGEDVAVSVLGVIQNHLLLGKPEPLMALLGPLMGLAMAPYFDVAVVAEEMKRSRTLARRELAGVRPPSVSTTVEREVRIPNLLLDPRARRARECLLHLAEQPGASNREIGQAAGIERDTQISTTLARLQALGLIDKQRAKPGGANSWQLTAHGAKVARLLRDVS